MHQKIDQLIKVLIVGMLLGICAPLNAGDLSTEKKFTFGIVPQQTASKLAEEWGPLLAEISERSGVILEFRTAPNIPVFEERLGRGEYDFAYMNPYHYVVFHKKMRYQAFSREMDKKIKGILVVRKESAYQKPSDLAGKTVVFPAPAAFAASILTQAELSRLHVPIEAMFVASHDSVYRAVASGLQEAGGGIERTFEASPPEIRSMLRVLSETPMFTPHAFAAQPRVPTDVVAKVFAAMQSLAGDNVGRKLLQPLAFKGFTAAQDKDWDDIRALNIKLLDEYTKHQITK